MDCPDFYAVYFRRTVKQLERTLWKEAKSLYRPYLYEEVNGKVRFKGKANIKEKDKVIIFPSGAIIEFSYLDLDGAVETNWQGAELTAAYFDEFTHFSPFAFNYIRTRMRSKSKYKSFIRCGLNPSPIHFVHGYIDRYLNLETGFVREELAGKEAWFVFDGGLQTAWTKEELIEKFPEKTPRNYMFIPSSLADNKIMLANNSTYREDLEANDPANAAMLLLGNWKYTPAANGVFERSCIDGHIVDKIPSGCIKIRAWDKAASKPAKEGGDSKQMNPDFTASIGFAIDKNRNVYIYGNYVEDAYGMQRARFREKPAQRDQYILEQAKADGPYVIQVLPQDNGQGGVFEFKESSKALQAEGFIVRKDPSISNISKSKRFDPFSAACFNGSIYWVRSTFHTEVWDYMLLELENFNPATKNNGFHDDLVDCFSSAWVAINTQKVHKPFTLPSTNSSTMLSAHRSTTR